MRNTASETRVSGTLGTVEFHSRPKQTAPYKTATIPSARLANTAITAQGAAPSINARNRKRKIEDAQTKHSTTRKRKTNTAKVRYVGYARSTELIGIEVKVRGLKADTYWLPYSQARKMWEQFSTEPFPTLV